MESSLGNAQKGIVNSKGARLYDVHRKRNDLYKHTGYSYEGNIFKKSLSSYILSEPNKKQILERIEHIIFGLIENVKMIKMFVNYTDKKDAKHIN